MISLIFKNENLVQRNSQEAPTTTRNATGHAKTTPTNHAHKARNNVWGWIQKVTGNKISLLFLFGIEDLDKLDSFFFILYQF